jgi:5-methyltetrahydropteroyltriglutamate--homocysteine methyltransferase
LSRSNSQASVSSSFERILTTHSGSLARPPKLAAMLKTIAAGKPVALDLFEAECLPAVNDVVRKQCEVGLDIINDGEMSKTGFAQYIDVRLNGFEGMPERRGGSLEDREFFEDDDEIQPTRLMLQPCTGPLSWKDFAGVERDIARLKSATSGLSGRQVFMTSLSPGSFTNFHPNRYYASREHYLAAIADVMKLEYEAIAAAGFIVQLDSPDLAQRSYNFPDLPLKEWRKLIIQNVEAANVATQSIPQQQIRVHVCWGANEGPHNHDTELKDIVDILLKLRCGAISIVGANGRHEHEWRVWENVKLPDGMKIIPGVIDSTTNIVEHLQTVADRLMRFASVLGRENVVGGVDCGFGTNADWLQVRPKVAWAKLRSLVDGAALASQMLWKN